MKKLILLIILATFGWRTANAQLVAVSTEATTDLLMMPNVGFELVTGERTTFGISAFFASKPWGKDVKIVGVQPEYRYFFSGRPMHSFFVGAGALGVSYDITWKGKVYDGMAFGIGATFGYVFNITHRLNIDCHAGFGAVVYRHKEYFVNDNYDLDYSIGGVERTNANGYALLPTRIGVSVSYILK